jgi:predicted transcriptional regulator
MLEVFNIRLPKSTIKKIDEIAKRRDRSRAWLIREALKKEFGGK